MVAGRAHGAKGVVRLARHHRVDRRDQRAGGAQRRLARARRGNGIAVDLGVTGLRDFGEDTVDLALRMHQADLRGRRPGRFAPR